ncbi:Uncharacterised protein [Citrobacter braakii]|nr:Uncharacterised protein [Citrobacter braakii]
MFNPALIDLLNALSPYIAPIVVFLMEWAKLELRKRYNCLNIK